MRPLFNHSLLTSFALYLDNQLVDDRGAQAYINQPTGTMYWQQGQSVSGYVWASPYKSWVYDSCVTGALIPSGVYNGLGQFLTRQSGIVLDFQNGRVISPHNWGSTLSGSYSRKEYNVYVSTPQQVDFWLEKNFGANQDIAYTLTGTKASLFSAPCVFLTNAHERNEPFAFGGQDQTDNTIRAFVISIGAWGQEGVCSIIRDMAKTYFPLASYGDWPLGASGDLKAGNSGFCYSALCARLGVAGVFVNNVYGYKFSQNTVKETEMMCSVLDVDCETLRQPHQTH